MTEIAVEDSLDWDRFVANYWARRPVLYTKVTPPPFAAPAVFAAARAACRAEPSDNIPSFVQFVVDNRQELTVADRLPSDADADFAGYGERILQQLGERRYALTLNGFHSFDFEMWDQQRRFYQPLWQRIGLPLTTAITTLFHGNYEHSPVGVHKDRFTTFMYVLSGRKRMRMWPKRPWDHDATTVVDYASMRSDSVAAEVEPGQLLYWPSSYYHVGENLSDEPATSVNVGVPLENHHARYELTELLVDATADTIIDATGQVLNAMPTPERQPLAPGPNDQLMLAQQPPAILAEARDRLASTLRTLAAGPRPTDMSLARYTAGGFTMVPPARERRILADTDTVVHERDHIILWRQTPDGQRRYGVNGHTVGTTMDVGEHDAVIEPLLDGRPHQIGTLLDRLPSSAATSSASRDAARRLLSALYRFRGLDLVGES